MSVHLAVNDAPGHRRFEGRLARECWSCALVLAPGQGSCPQCARPTIEAEVPFLLRGRYRLVRRLGSGGMGVVYQALDLLLDRPVALKTMLPATAASAASLRREARVLGALGHPHLVAVHDLCFWQGRPVLVLELLAGGTLEQRLAGGTALPLEEVVAVGLGVGAALSYLHDCGLVHGDVKPSNVGFAADGTPKLLDFGLTRGSAQVPDGAARAKPATVRHTSVYGNESAGAVIYGTLNYLSPEALDGHAARPATDLWALGVVLWEATTGRRLFGGDARTVVRQIRRVQVPPLPASTPRAAALAGAVSAALEADPHRRLAGHADLVARLAEFLPLVRPSLQLR